VRESINIEKADFTPTSISFFGKAQFHLTDFTI